MSAVPAVLAAVLNSLWLAALAAAMIWLALRWAPVNAATRYAIWWVVLAGILALPLVPRIRIHARNSAAPAAIVPKLAAAPAAESDPAVVTIEPSPASAWPLWILSAWSLVLICKLARVAQSYVHLRGVRSRASVASRRLPGLARPARLLFSCEISSPMAAGFLPPAVLIPAALPAQVSAAELDCVLLHEAAHLARRDDWMNLLTRLLGAALALHPVAWWILRLIEREQEMACDDWVVAHTGAARAYAVSLARMYDLRWPRADTLLAAGIFGRRSKLGDRIAMLLARGREFSPRISTKRVAMVAAALLVLAIAGGLAPRWIALAQHVEFEVASVKPADADSGSVKRGLGIGLFTFPGGRIRGEDVPLLYLLSEAFGLQEFQISGGPAWLRTDRFDLEAKPPANSASSHSNPRISKLPPNAEQRQMLLALLEDRFQLKYHREGREGPVYYLVKTNKEPKLQPTKDPEQYPWAGPAAGGAPFGDGIRGENISMPQLAERFSGIIGRPVLDRTGLNGAFDFVYVNPKADPDSLVATILSSVQGLGLKLESGKGPVETVVIDRAEKLKGN